MRTVKSNEKIVHEEKTLQEQIEDHIEMLENLNKTICSNSSHPQYDLLTCESIQESLLDYQDSETISNDG